MIAKLNRGERNEKNTFSRSRPAGIRISGPSQDATKNDATKNDAMKQDAMKKDAAVKPADPELKVVLDFLRSL